MSSAERVQSLIQARIDTAIKMAYNKSYAEGKIKEAEKYAAQLSEKFADEAAEYLSNTFPQLVKQAQDAILEKNKETDIKNATRKLEVAWKSYERDMTRFPDRAEKALNQILGEHLDLLRAYNDQGALVTQWEAKAQTALKELAQINERKELIRALDTTKTPLSQATRECDVYERPSQVERYLEEALNKFQKNFEENSSFDQLDQELVQEYREKFYSQYMDMKEKLNQLAVKKDLKRAGDAMIQNLSHAKMYFDRSRSQAQDYYERAIDGKEEFMLNPSFENHPLTPDYLDKFNAKLNEYEEFAYEQDMKKKIRDLSNSCMLKLSTANSYLRRSPETALQYIEEAKEMADAIATDETLSARPEVAQFFEKYEERLSKLEKDYEAEIIGNLMREAKSGIHVALSSARAYKNDFSRQMDYIQIAQDKLMEVQTGPDSDLLMRQEEMKNYVDEATQEIEAIEAELQDKIAANEARQCVNDVALRLTWAKSALHSHNYQRALECLEEAKDLKDSLEVFGTIAERDEVKEFISKFEEDAPALEKEVNEKVLAEEMRDSRNSVTTTLAGLSHRIQRKEYAAALEILNKAQDKILHLAAAFPEESRDFVEEQNAKIMEQRDEISEQMLKDEEKAAVDAIENNIRNATVYLSSHRSAQAMEYMERAVEAKSDLEFNARLSERPKIQEFLSSFDQKESAFREEFAEKESKEKIKQLKSTAEGALRNARIYFDSHQYDFSKEHLEKARDAQVNLITDPEVSSLKQIQEFAAEFDEAVAAFEQECQEKLAEESAKLSMNAVVTKLSNARSYFPNRASQSLEYLEQAKEALDDIRFDSQTKVTDEWMDNMSDKIDEFEREYYAVCRAGDIKRSKESVETPLRSSSSYIKSSKQTALSYLEKAQDALSTFIAQYPSESEFINDVGKRISEEQDKIQKLIHSEEIKGKKNSINTVLNSAKAYIKSHRESQALQLLQNVLDKTIDLEQYGEAEQKFIDEINNEVDTLQRDVIQSAFEEEVKRKISKVELLLNNAATYMDRSQRERGLEYLQQAEDAAEELASNEGYLKMEMVSDFFSSFNSKLNDMKEKFNQAIYGQEVKKNKDSIQTSLSNSKVYFNSSRFDRALQLLSEAKEKFADFASNKNYVNEGSFVSEMQIALDTFEREFTERVYKNEVLNAIKKLDHFFQEASRFLSRSAFSSALASFEKAVSESEALSSYSSHSLAQERLEKFKKEREEFEKEYAEKALRKESNKIASKLRTNIHVGRVLMQQNLTARVIDQLDKLREIIQSECSTLMRKSSEVQSALTEFESFRTEAASNLLSQEANRELKRAKRSLEKIEIFLQRGLDKKAAELLPEFVQENTMLLDSEKSNLTALDNVKEFIAEVDRIASSLQLSLTDLLAPSASQASVSSAEGEDALFTAHGTIEDLRLESIPMSTSISSKVFNAVKKYNTEVGRINQLVRKFQREVKSIELPSGENLAHLSSYEDLSRYLKDLKKAEATIPDEAKDDENAKTIHTQVDRYTQWVDNVKKQVEEITNRQAALLSVKSTYAAAVELMEHGEAFLKGGTIPAQVTILSSNSGLSFSTSKPHDYELFLNAYNKAQEGNRAVARYAEKYDGFPQELFTEKFDSLSKKALKLHVKHCMRGFNVVSSAHRGFYMEALRRFPLARRYALKQLEEQRINAYVGHMTDIADDKMYEFQDPYADVEVSDAFDENEEDYLPSFELITPADASAPEKNRPHESQNPMYWNKFKESHTGEIVFSKKAIDRNEKSDDVLESEFTYGKDEIFGRAIWRNSIANFAIAKDKKTGEYLYPPEKNTRVKGTAGVAFITDLLFFVKIDGKPVENINEYCGSFFYDEERKVGSKDNNIVDFYSWNQSIQLFVLKHKLSFTDRYETNSVGRFNRELSRLSPGKHSVEVELRYLIRATNENRSANDPIFPDVTSKISEPIAKGSFSVNIPKNVAMVNLLPERTSPLSNAAQIEQAALKMLRESHDWGKRSPKREQVITTWATSDMYCSRRHWLTEKPIQWGTDFSALVYRNPEDYWKKEEMAIFRLATYSELERQQIPPCHGVGVGGNLTFEPDFLPEELLKNVESRYSGDKSDPFKRLSEEERKRFFEQPWAEY